MPPDPESNIVCTLNDDCIQEIFQRLKFLADLTNVAEVCVRFNKHAKTAFALQHKHWDLSQVSFLHGSLIETAMKHFGKDTHSLCIRCNFFYPKVDTLSLIGQNFGSKLKQIEVQNCRFKNIPQPLRPIFAGIEQLKLSACTGSIGLSELLTSCVELKSLTISCGLGIDGQNDDCDAMMQTFSKLQEFSLHLVDIEEEMFESFVARHPTLIRLSIEDTSVTPSVLRAIGVHAKNLQELKFVLNCHDNDSDDNEDYQQLPNDVAFIGQLSSLKKLHADLDSVLLLAVLNALVANATPIESLEVWLRSELDGDDGDDGGDALKSISQLKQIKTLLLTTDSTTHHVTDGDIIGLAKNLPDLEEFDVMDCFHLSQLSTIGLRKMLVYATKLKLLKMQRIGSIKTDIDDYKAMLSTVQKRKEKVPLVIEIHGKADQVDVPATVLAENRKTLDVKVICY